MVAPPPPTCIAVLVRAITAAVDMTEKSAKSLKKRISVTYRK
jgi:hypothetical protein